MCLRSLPWWRSPHCLRAATTPGPEGRGFPGQRETVCGLLDPDCFGSSCVPSDTSFMYMIAGLCMLKLYQTRHPDINASAYSAYASFAVVITLTVLGVVRPSPRPPARLSKRAPWGGFLLFICLFVGPHGNSFELITILGS